MLDKIKQLMRYSNEHGVYFPVVRDPLYQTPSVTLTTVVVSFGMCVIGLIGKASGFLGGVDMSQALTLFAISSGIYLGRRIGKSPDGSVEISEQEKKD
jgi:hypothetical protein